jgi:hypothetical protein
MLTGKDCFSLGGSSLSFSTAVSVVVVKKGAQVIFDRSDFHDFHTLKPFWVGDFGVKTSHIS